MTLSVNAELLEPAQVEDLKELLNEFRETFSVRSGGTDLVTHEIELTSAEPVKSKAYRVSPPQK